MGILKSGPFGPFRKKVGPAIGRRHMGQNLLLPLPHKSNQPATAKQMVAQVKLGLLNSFLNNIDPLINIGFKRYVKHNSPVNAAFSYNYGHAFVKQDGQFRINYSKIVYSRGHIVTPEEPELIPEPGKITFEWQRQQQSAYCQFTDLASFLVYFPSKNYGLIVLDQVNRFVQKYVVELPPDCSGETVHCYMNFRSADGKLNGDSCYVGAALLP